MRNKSVLGTVKRKGHSTYSLHSGCDRAHNNECVQRLGLIPLMRDLSPQLDLLLLGQDVQLLKGQRVLRNERALLELVDMLPQPVFLRKSLCISQELGARDTLERVFELRVDVLVQIASNDGLVLALQTLVLDVLDVRVRAVQTLLRRCLFVHLS